MRGNSGKRPRYLIIPRVPASCCRKQPPAFMQVIVAIAATSIEYDKFDMAEIYIQKALDYKRTNEAWFTTDTLYSMIFRKLFRQRLVHCDQLITDTKYR